MIPVYNKEPHIHRSIKSVLTQSFQNFELIIVCDPSTDNSTEEVYKFTDSRITVFHRKAPGPGGYAARNLGVQKAKSDWIVFLDADDEMLENHLLYLNTLITREVTACMLSSGWHLHGTAANSKDAFSLENEGSSNLVIPFKKYVKCEVMGLRPIWTSVACIKKDIILAAGLFPENKITMGGDVDTWLRCVYQAKAIYWSNHIGAIYHTDSVNMVTRSSVIDPRLHVNTTESLLESINDKELKRALKTRSNNLVITAWNNNMQSGICNHFRLRDYLYCDKRLLRTSLYVAFSLLPAKLQVHVYRHVFKLYLAFKQMHSMKTYSS